ncbi:class I SAM-dependent methyltransferase [Rufibacter sp. XAAS-G3-1]|uniref:class I SAM-dependent methyltransferase n=1 Tax=Rufibacter sp. XAAS-G3-1 TaxID=2729134 RepID=UPI0015E66290|nr:class I SAM-dependent methyltransferase [Rufibacter sp. XAAS-G3-1]
MRLIKKVKKYMAIHFPTEKNATKRVISFWEKGGPDFEYYASADQEDWIKVFWEENTVFCKLFQTLDLKYTLEIACGTGRHSAQVSDKIEKLYLLDTSKAALDLAEQRFGNQKDVEYIHHQSGLGIPVDRIKDNALTAVFSYDAMVHFEKEAVESYLADSYRVLKPGAYALFHHSNYDKNPGGKFSDNPGWRNYMTKSLFCSLSEKYGFQVVHSEVFSFSTTDSDCVTLLKKP